MTAMASWPFGDLRPFSFDLVVADTAATLARILYQHSCVIVPIEPTKKMVDASMATICNFDVLTTKSNKHRVRIRAAVDAYVSDRWPTLKDNRSARVAEVSKCRRIPALNIASLSEDGSR